MTESPGPTPTPAPEPSSPEPLSPEPLTREPLTPELDATIREIFDGRDRSDMQPTIDAFLALLAEHPGQPEVLYEVGGSYDTAGEEQTALGYYEAAMNAGLSGDVLRKCLMQYGSTLRILGRYDESLAALDRALDEYPASASVRAFHALALHAAGRSDGAVGELLELVADAVRTPEVLRYEAALRGNAAYLTQLDAERPGSVSDRRRPAARSTGG